MGADLIAASLMLPLDSEPDWEEAKDTLYCLDPGALKRQPWSNAFEYTDYFEYHDEPDTLDTRYNALSQAISTVQKMYTERWRNTVLHRHDDCRIWIVGETSYGENPQGWEELTLFIESGLHLTAGFIS